MTLQTSPGPSKDEANDTQGMQERREGRQGVSEEIQGMQQRVIAYASELPLTSQEGRNAMAERSCAPRDQPLPRSHLPCSPLKHPQIRPVPQTVWIKRDLLFLRRESGWCCPVHAPLGWLPSCSAAVCVSVRRKYQRPDSDDG